MRHVGPWVVVIVIALAGCMGPTTEPEPSTSPSGFTETAVFPGSYRMVNGHARPLDAGPYTIGAPLVDRITSEDGTQLAVATYLPEGGEGPWPTILSVAPFFPVMTPEELAAFPIGDMLVQPLVPHGYAVVLVGLRGTSESEGCIDLFGPGELGDVRASLNWVVDRSWSNGRIGMMGLSYAGGTAWMGASTGHPALETIVPIAGLTDVWSAMFFNGTFGYSNALAAPGYWLGSITEYGGGEPRRAACPETAQVTLAADYSLATGLRDPAGIWAQRNYRERIVEHYDGSVFLIQGLHDTAVPSSQTLPWIQVLREQGLLVKMMIGQWTHALPDGFNGPGDPELVRVDWMEHLLRWFDHELKDAPVELGSPVQVQDGTRAWRSGTDWPPLDATATTWYLGDGASMHTDPDQAKSGTYRTTPQPAGGHLIKDDVDLCPTCPTLLTEPFEKTVRIAGSPRIHTTVVPHAPGGEITAKLFAVAPDGNHRQIGWAQMDLRFHEGGEQMHTVVPEQPIVAQMQAQMLDDVIPEGHRLAVTLAQAEGGDRWEEPINAPIDWIVGGDASRIILDVVEPEPEAYFQPPSEPIPEPTVEVAPEPDEVRALRARPDAQTSSNCISCSD